MLSRLCLSGGVSRRVLSNSSGLLKAKILGDKPEGVKSAQKQVDEWSKVNQTTSRPMSPYLGIYRWSIPMTFSAFNRIFSFVLVAAFFLIPFADFFGSGDIAADIQELSATMRESLVGTVALWVLKGAVLYPFFFHTFAGFRHWGWDIFAVGIRDAGTLNGLGTLYKTGYAAIFGALLFTAIIVLWPDIKKATS